MGGDERPKKACVVGMGPGGLSAALALIASGFNVDLYESRSEFTRFQRIYLPVQLVRAFYSISSLPKQGAVLEFTDRFQFNINVPEGQKLDDDIDTQFFRSLQAKQCLIPLYDLQDYLLSKLKKIASEKSVERFDAQGTSKKWDINKVDSLGQKLGDKEKKYVEIVMEVM